MAPFTGLSAARRRRFLPWTFWNVPPMSRRERSSLTVRTTLSAPPPQMRPPVSAMAAMCLAPLPPMVVKEPPAKMRLPLEASARTSALALGFHEVSTPAVVNAARLLRVAVVPLTSVTVVKFPPM